MTETRMTLEQWRAEGERRFGPDRRQWRFVCPVCGNVQTQEQMRAAGAPPSSAYRECIGRYVPDVASRALGGSIAPSAPCDYAAFGAVRRGPVQVEGTEYPVFDFAPADGPP